MKLGDLVELDEQLVVKYFLRDKKVAIWASQDSHAGDFCLGQVGIVVDLGASEEGVAIVSSSGAIGRIWTGVLRVVLERPE